jgi:hypothetical protein
MAVLSGSKRFEALPVQPQLVVDNSVYPAQHLTRLLNPL